MEFTFNPSTDLADVAYNTGLRVTNNAADSLDAWIAAGVAFKSESPKRRKEYARYAVSHPEIDMTADSFDKRLGEAVKLARKFDTVEGVESAIDEREANGQSRSFSLQIISAALCGNGHKADKRVKAEADKAETETTEDAPSVKGDPVAAIAAILQGIDNVGDLSLVAHMVEARRDMLAAAPVTV
jgi:hypothetical protein